jgi:hypothetical protein
MQYNENNVPVDVTVWAYAYHSPHSMFNIKPMAGKVITKQVKVQGCAMEYKEFHYCDSDGRKAFSNVHNLLFTDTEREATDNYNKLVLQRIRKINKMLEDVVSDYILGFNRR